MDPIVSAARERSSKFTKEIQARREDARQESLAERLETKSSMFTAMKAKYQALKAEMEDLKKKHFNEIAKVTRDKNSAEAMLVSMQARVDWTTECLANKEHRKDQLLPPAPPKSRSGASSARMPRPTPSPSPRMQRLHNRPWSASPSAKGFFTRPSGTRGTKDDRIREARRVVADLAKTVDLLSADVLELLLPLKQLLSLQLSPFSAFEKVILAEMKALVNCESAGIALVDLESRSLLLKLDSHKHELSMSVDECLAGHVALNPQIANLRDPYTDYRFHPAVDYVTGNETTSALALPVFDSNGVVIAVLEMHNAEGGNFDTKAESLLRCFGEVLGAMLGHELSVEKEVTLNPTFQSARSLPSLCCAESSLQRSRCSIHERQSELCQQLWENTDLCHNEELVTQEANIMVPCSTVRLLWVNQSRGTLWSLSSKESFECNLASSVEGSSINKSLTLCTNPPAHPLYNPAVDAHFGSVPDNILISTISKAKMPLAVLVFGDKLDGSEFSSCDKEAIKTLCQRVAPPMAQSMLAHRLSKFGDFLNGIEPGKQKMSALVRKFGEEGPKILELTSVSLYICDPCRGVLWTIAPGDTTKSNVPLTDLDAKAAFDADGPITVVRPCAKGELPVSTVYAAIKDTSSPAQALGLMELRGAPGQAFAPSHLTLIQMLMKQTVKLLRDSKQHRATFKQLAANAFELQFVSNTAVDQTGQEIGLRVQKIVGELMPGCKCQLLSYIEEKEIYQDVVTGKAFGAGFQVKLALHSRKSHLLQLEHDVRVITPVFNHRNLPVFLLVIKTDKVSERLLAQLDHLAGCITGVMENVHKYRRKDLLVRVSQELYSDLSSSVIIRKICDRACQFTHAEVARLFAMDSASDEIKLLSTTGDALTLRQGEGIVGYCGSHQQAVNVPDVYKDPNFSAAIDLVPQMYCKTTCCMPLLSDGENVGVLQVLKRNGTFSEDDVMHLRDLSDVAALALSNTILVEANKSANFGALTMLVDPSGMVLRVNRDPLAFSRVNVWQQVIGASKSVLTSKPLRQSLVVNPDVVSVVEKTQSAGSPATVVNASFMIGQNMHYVDYTVVPYQGTGPYETGHVWLVVSRVTPVRPDMKLSSGQHAIDAIKSTASGRQEIKTDRQQCVAVMVHFFIRDEDSKVPLGGDAAEEAAGLQLTVEEYLPVCMELLSQCSLLGVLERFEGTTMTFTFGMPRPTEDDIAQGCMLAFRLRDSLAGINKQRAIMGLPPISTTAMVKTADVECGPSKWTSGPISYDWLDKSISDLLPVTLHYGIHGVMVADQTLESVGKHCVSREIDNVFLPFSGLHCCVHEVISQTDDAPPTPLIKNLTLYAEGLAAYRARRWITAIEVFQKMIDLCNDRPSKAMIQHCHYWIKRDVGSYWDTSWELFEEDPDEHDELALSPILPQ